MADAIDNSQPLGENLTLYWNTIFSETPRCKSPGCQRVAHEVDAFFPYIDDHNRCDHHPGATEPLTIN